MNADQLILLVAEKLQGTDVTWHIDSYPTTRAAAERFLRTMGIIPSEPPRALPPATSNNETTSVLPTYGRGVAEVKPPPVAPREGGYRYNPFRQRQ